MFEAETAAAVGIQRLVDCAAQGIDVGVAFEQSRDPGGLPQRRLAGPRFEHGLVAGIAERDRDRAQALEQQFDQWGAGFVYGEVGLQPHGEF